MIAPPSLHAIIYCHLLLFIVTCRLPFASFIVTCFYFLSLAILIIYCHLLLFLVTCRFDHLLSLVFIQQNKL